MRFDIITTFPGVFDSYFNESLFKRALKKKIVDIGVHNLRDYTNDRHKKTDDTPYGGGPGMVLKAEPIAKVVARLRMRGKKKNKTRVILFSTRGKKLDELAAQRLTKYDRLILICGRYEGVDERVAKYVADEELSIGDYVLSGGELAAMVVIDTVARKVPGFLGKHESLEEIKGSYPVYTRPEAIVIDGQKRRVPKILLGGRHIDIEKWRRANGRFI